MNDAKLPNAQAQRQMQAGGASLSRWLRAPVAVRCSAVLGLLALLILPTHSGIQTKAGEDVPAECSAYLIVGVRETADGRIYQCVVGGEWAPADGAERPRLKFEQARLTVMRQIVADFEKQAGERKSGL